ncbi:Lrp/AsnC family transcriptional regulator [Sphingomonas oligophenolica]|uniref:Lrp/AsnC family transcriptional regulator n=1 Tax=Sphingomonas oligophenolica TaxID=301154 RepID=A0ABU9Y198_9SPHN
MDDTDLKILRLLQAKPATTMTELADQVGLSQTPCWRRVKQLEASGVIVRRALLLDAHKLGFSVDVFAHLRIGRHDEDNLEAFEEAVRVHPEILECFSMSGESDYLMRIVVRSIEHYERFLKKVLLHLPGVASVNSSFALKQVKVTTNVPV